MENKYSDGKNRVALDNSQSTHYQYTKVVWLNSKHGKKVTHCLPIKLIKVSIHVDKDVPNLAFSSRTVIGMKKLKLAFWSRNFLFGNLS